MEDDLEYYITFPTPTPRETLGNVTKDEEEDFVFINGANGEKEPVVFLLGWLGAKDQHLAKYCSIYNQRGPRVKLMPIARKLLALLKDMSLDAHPVFFHVLSNNGSTLYYYITQALEETDAPVIDIKGLIFDSTPAPRRVYSGTRAIYEITAGSIWMKLCASLGMMIYLMSWGVLSVLWTIISGKLPKYPPWSLVEERLRCPQLFLYSKADKLIAADDVEFFITERQKLGVPVMKRCWDDSPHVQHFRHHPEEYSNSIYNFLSTCLSKGSVAKGDAPSCDEKEKEKPKSD